jgi:hypothetical protein
LKGLDSPIWIKAILPISLYLNSVSAMEIPINYISWNGGTKNDEHAHVDSGTTENFLDFHMITRWQLPTQKLQNLWQIFNVDRTENKLG